MNSKNKNKQEIKKSKSEFNFHLNLDKINDQKNFILNLGNSKNISNSQDDNSNENEKLPLSLNINQNNTIKSLDSDTSKENKEENTTDIKWKNLISTNYNNYKNIKICPCCNKKFDNKKYVPLILKCNHIFCKICLGKYFSDNDNIICPIDGPMGKSLKDLKNIKDLTSNHKKKRNNDKTDLNNIQKFFHKSISHKELFKNSINPYLKSNFNFMSLTNRNKEAFFTNNNYNNNSNTKIIFDKAENYIKNKQNKKTQKNKNKKSRSKSALNSYFNNNEFCSIHPEQRITHFVEETKELICIHCAFNKLKNNSNIKIKEIPEKCKEYISDLESIIENYKNYIQIVKNSMNHINENKQNEEKKIIEIYDELQNLLLTNRNNYLIKIEEIYQQNKINMNKTLEHFEEIMNISEKLKDDFSFVHNKAPNEFNFLTQAFNQFIREINDKNNSEINVIQYNFSHDEVNKIIKYINNFADVKSKKKVYKFKFDLDKNEDNININKDYYKKYFNIFSPPKSNKKEEIKDTNLKNKFNEYYVKNKSDILNKYIIPTNMMRDSLYSISNMKNSSIENDTNESNNIYKYLKDNDRLNFLKKYKYPLKIY